MNRVIVLAIVLAMSTVASAATYVVNSSADTTDTVCDVTNCTLREAIAAANADGGGTIHFAIGSGAATITLTFALPDLTTPVIIDGTTQPGYAGTPLIAVTGGSTAWDCLVLRASDSVIRGLDIGLCRDAIAVISSTAMTNIAIERNFIGTRMATAPIMRKGIRLEAVGTSTLSGVTIGNSTPAGRNIIATFGFVEDGLFISGNVSDVTVAGNYFGIDESGTGIVTAARFTTDVTVQGSAISNNIMIGGPAPADRNVFGSGGGTQLNVKIDSLGSGLTIEGNYIGTDPTGMIRRAATNFGVWFFAEGTATIRNNLITTSGGNAVSRGVTTTGPVIVQGNWINVKADGTAFPFVPSTAIQDFSSVPGYVIGGPNPGDGNVIANYSTGVFVVSPGAVVQGNLIGLDPTGTNILGSGARGIATSFARTEPGVFFRDNKIAGFTTGIEVGNESKATVENNYVGMDATGTLARPNTTGIAISGAAGRAIVTGNVIAGNTSHGILVGTSTMPVSLAGNRIGLNAANVPLPNGGDGIRITSGTAQKNIGFLAGVSNTIANNGGAGVNVQGGTATTILGNSIFDNTGLAIDLGTAGVTANDVTDVDTGANGLQNAPMLVGASNGAGGTTVEGLLHSTPVRTFTVELYANTAADPSLHGEAQTFLTRFDVATNGAGDAPFSTLIPAVAPGTIISASATDTVTLETSEMSNDVTVVSGGILEFSAAATSINESAGTITITVTRTGGSVPATVDYASADGTAIAGSDYTAVAGTLNFAAADTSQTIDVPITNDALDELDETFTLTLSNVNGGALGTTISTTVTINDDDATPSLSVSDASVVEGNAGTSTLSFDVTLNASSGQVVTVDYTTTDQTATSGPDYGQRFGTLTFAPGETSKTIAVIVNGDVTTEANETLQLLLSSAVNATIGDDTGIGTITNDDGDPSISIADAVIIEGNSGTSNASVTLTLSNPSSSTVTVDWATSANTATALSDFTTSNATVTFNAGETSKTITAPITGDTIVEGNESFFVDLTNPANANIVDAQSEVTIVDDDGSPSLTISDLAVSESTGPATLTVLLAPASDQTVTVNWSTVDLTASGVDDYAQGGATLTFAPGDTSQTISVAIVGDSLTETSETFGILLGSPSNASVADGQATVTIIDDDPTPRVTVSDIGVVEGTTATFTVTLSNASAFPVTVNWATGDSTAGTSDYAPAAGVLTFNPGQTSLTVDVATTQETLQESAEMFFVNILTATNATIVRAQATAIIVDDDGTPALMIGDATAPETDAGTVLMSFVVTLAGNAAQTVTVDYSTANGTATSGSDYALSTGHVIFTPGTTMQTINVPVVGDTNVETDETLFVNLSGSTNATISDNQAVGTILNDDTAPVVPSISISDASVSEGNAGTATASFTVTLSEATTVTVTVDYATANGTATFGSDYASASGTLVFAPGATSRTISVAVAGDTLVEGNETLVVDLTNADNGTIVDAQAAGTILDDDVPAVVPAISISDVSVAEGHSGTTNTTFAVTLSAATTNTVTVDYTTANGTANAGSDYATNSGTLVFAPSVLTQSITIAVAGDTDVEADETFAVNLTNATNATILDAQGLGTITNDDSAAVVPTISISDVSVAEGDSGTTNATFTVTLSAATTNTVTVDFLTANGTANAGSDYATNSGTLVFAPSVLTQSITIAVAGDTDVEADETFVVDLTNAANATILDAQGTGTITNDDSAAVVPTISISDVSVAEGDSGTTNETFAVTLSAATTNTVTVDFTTANGTATAGSDYATNSGTLVFAPSVLTQSITIAVAGDTNVEPDETFVVDLTNAANATILDAQGTGTITNDDSAAVVPTISISDVSVAEGDSGTTNATFAVTLSAATTNTVTVDYTTANGTANAGSDYATNSGTLVFAPSVLAQNITIAVAGDTNIEPDETFAVDLTNAANATILDAQGTGTITNDDSAAVVPTISISDVSVAEGDSGTTNATFAVTLSAATTNTVTVDYTTANGTANAGSDYATNGGTLVFAPSVLTQSITIAVAGDANIEPDETFAVDLTNAANATILDAQGLGTIANDDTAALTPSISIDGTRIIEGNDGTRTANFDVTLSTAASSTITVDYATRSGTATPPEDYVSLSGALVFTPGTRTRRISVVVLGDTTVESDETFSVRLSNAAGATIVDSQATATIVNDDQPSSPPSLSIAPASVLEGDSGAAAMSFVVTLSHTATTPVTVAYATHDATAHAGSDYLATIGTLAFAAGETAREIVVAINGDTIAEGDETFTMALSAPIGATLATDHAAGTIEDDDASSVRAVFVIVGSGAGNGGAYFRTQLQLHNATDAPIGGELLFHPLGGGAPQRFGYALDPHETRDIGAMLENGFGSIDVAPLTGALPLGTMRVYNDGAAHGQPGFLAPLVGIEHAIRPGHRGLLLAPADALAMRYNLGMRALDAGASLTLTLRRADGTIAATVDRALAPNVLQQIAAGVLFGTTLQNNDAIEIAVTSGAVIVYGSAVENTSQDPSMIVATPLP